VQENKILKGEKLYWFFNRMSDWKSERIDSKSWKKY